MTIEYDQIERLEALLAERNDRIDALEAGLEEAVKVVRQNAGTISALRVRIAELEAQIIQQTGISASRMEERERLQKQIAALREIAIEEVAIRIAYENNMCLVECRGYARRQARRQLAKDHPEAFR